ncbi:type II toxin-antitoxin system Phd/YefM family antitoxin [Jannaschia sp. Os4]|uniref:type II toxin-antitoxin system Phd/YefM family antitoxin n=1 Tax=Jannaschia sp. Os4 TaxID=2807617 RepID=UPI00193946C5|nr:type II toxin-antitoxin system Phd/YefM family antitoxin [Jannaschia sp. Os4]MBM2575035.1 type II toxin-antitoxin system Phd/YefM family antitoxin [Jannaschia sp. Os4]
MPKTPLDGPAPRLPVSEARERLADLCAHVRDGEDAVVLTRHGRAVAALVGMAWLDRFARVEEQDADAAAGWVPNGLRRDGDRYLSPSEAAVRLRQVQLDRAAERRLLARAGLEPIPGGEVAAPVARVEAEAPPPAAPPAPRARWSPWAWRRG